MNITRSSINNSIILVVRYNRIINSENKIKNWMKKQFMYWALAFGKTNKVDRTKTVMLMECSSRCRRRRFAAAPDLDEERAVMKILEQSRWAFPKNLICPLPVQDFEDGGFGDISRSSVHAGARDGADYEGGATARRRQNPHSSWFFFLVKGNGSFI